MSAAPQPPAPWVATMDPNSGHYYYYNPQTLVRGFIKIWILYWPEFWQSLLFALRLLIDVASFECSCRKPNGNFQQQNLVRQHPLHNHSLPILPHNTEMGVVVVLMGLHVTADHQTEAIEVGMVAVAQ